MAIDRRKRPLIRQPGDWRDATLFIVATEGEKTEPRYFEIFSHPRVKIKTIECPDGKSAPEHVLDRMVQFAQSFHFGDGDSFWLVIDRDRWTIKSLSYVYMECRKKGYNLTISNPCFEAWLAFHFDDKIPIPATQKSLSSHLRSLLGSYSKSEYPLEILKESVERACRNAELNDKGENEIWPESPGSRVYVLVKELLRNFD